MPYGSGPLIREALMRAAPWQRYVIGVAMVAAGVVIVILGHVAGGLLAIAGVLLLWRMVRNRFGGRLETPRSGPGTGSP